MHVDIKVNYYLKVLKNDSMDWKNIKKSFREVFLYFC